MLCSNICRMNYLAIKRSQAGSGVNGRLRGSGILKCRCSCRIRNLAGFVNDRKRLFSSGKRSIRPCNNPSVQTNGARGLLPAESRGRISELANKIFRSLVYLRKRSVAKPITHALIAEALSVLVLQRDRDPIPDDHRGPTLQRLEIRAAMPRTAFAHALPTLVRPESLRRNLPRPRFHAHARPCEEFYFEGGVCTMNVA